MPDSRALIYWDTCVVLDYLRGNTPNATLLKEIARQSQEPSGTIRLVTSVLTVTEVAFIRNDEGLPQLTDEQLKIIDDFWNYPTGIVLIEFHQLIARQAREFIRDAQRESRSLKPADAVHLASALSVNARELHTDDDRLIRLPSVGGLSITKPTLD